MTEFKVGDKVTHDDHGDGEIKYGPYDTFFAEAVYLVAFAGAKHGATLAEHLTPRPAFKVGDTVSMRDFGGGTVVYGPTRDTAGMARYLVADDDGTAVYALEREITPAKPTPLAVGDKIRILKSGLDGADVVEGEIRTVTEKGESYFLTDSASGARLRQWSFVTGDESTGWERMTEDTETISGDAYVMGAKYKDRTGDFWEFTRHGGRVSGRWHDNNDNGGSGWSLAVAIDEFGPLTRVED